MHISEGVLSAEYVVGGYVAATALTAVALKKLKKEDIPKVSVMGAAFFVSSLIHFKIGPTSVHLTLIGLTGIVLGAPSILAVLTGLFFQAVMFQHGGLTTLGVNTVTMGCSALAVYYAFSQVRAKLAGKKTLLAAAGGVFSGLGILLATLMVAALLALSSEAFTGMAVFFSISQGILAIVEGVISFLVIQQLLRIKPELILGKSPPLTRLHDDR